LSKRINVNPDHYKTRGRERPGKDIASEAVRPESNRPKRARHADAPHIPNQERAGRKKPAPGRTTETS
jgi:hypothetical protein